MPKLVLSKARKTATVPASILPNVVVVVLPVSNVKMEFVPIYVAKMKYTRMKFRNVYLGNVLLPVKVIYT